MECKACGYALWNLRDRACPECGSPFRPSDFEFRPGAVRFMCPHCGQDYYGTDARGHLVPRHFDCVSCHRPVAMDDCVLLPAEGVREGATTRRALPWAQRGRLGFFRAWWRTSVMSMIRPHDLMAARADADSLASAWGFFATTALIVTLVGSLAMVAVMGLFAFIAALAGGGGGGAMPAGALSSMLLFQLMAYAAGMVFFVVFLVVWALTTHAALRLSGATEGSIRTTFHAILYSGGTSVLAIVPCVSNFAWIWWIVSAILMVREGHRVSGVRATFSVLAAPIISIALLIAGYAALLAAVFANITPATGMAVGPGPELAALADAAEARAADTARGWDHTDHALLLVVEGRVSPYDFITAGSPTILDDIPVGKGTLAEVDETPGALAALADNIPALPEGVVAHRVGDFVFTWHGIDAADPPPGLWIIIEHDASDTGFGTLPAHARTTDGAVETLWPWSRPNALQLQNALRATHGLPPLPDPTTVTQP